MMPTVYQDRGKRRYIAVEAKVVNDNSVIFIYDEKYGQELKNWVMRSNKAFQRQVEKTEWIATPILIQEDKITVLHS